MIYFVQDGEDGPIKIGYSDDVVRRIAELSIGAHRELRVLLVISGEIEQEKQLHDRFSFAHKKGEWFWPVNELLSFIDKYKLSMVESPTEIPAHLIQLPPLDEVRICELWDKGISLNGICLDIFRHKPSGRQYARVREIIIKSGRTQRVGRTTHRQSKIDESEICQLHDQGVSLRGICLSVFGTTPGGRQVKIIKEILTKSGRTVKPRGW